MERLRRRFVLPSELSHLEKVKAVEHLVILAQLSDLRVMTSPDL